MGSHTKAPLRLFWSNLQMVAPRSDNITATITTTIITLTTINNITKCIKARVAGETLVTHRVIVVTFLVLINRAIFLTVIKYLISR